MKRLILAAFAASAAFSPVAFAQEPPQLYGDYSSAVQERYNKGPAERQYDYGTIYEPMPLDTMPTASIPDDVDDRMLGSGTDTELNYGPNVRERDVGGR